MRRLASRYIAGETLVEALGRMGELARMGYPSIIDILGEDVTSREAAFEVMDRYEEAAHAVAVRGLDAYVSIKPTHLGLRISERLALECYSHVAQRCRELGLFVRVEMEDHTTTDATLRLFEELRKSFDNVGVVLQSRLLRTPSDIRRLAPGPLDVRMVKGIYLEPGAIAYEEPEPIRRAYAECVRMLAERDARIRFATHDSLLAGELIDCVRELGRDPEQYEFQVLLGVRGDLWQRWRTEGHAVRVYVPYGPEWRPYSLRRMGKNPQILRHVIRQALSFRK
jgi:proline dehydrogenase